MDMLDGNVQVTLLQEKMRHGFEALKSPRQAFEAFQNHAQPFIFDYSLNLITLAGDIPANPANSFRLK